MEANELPSNSHKFKEGPNETKEITEKKVEKVITGNVKRQKPGLGKKFSEVFLAEDMNEVKDHIFWDVIVPSIKNGISDILINTVQSIFGGGPSRSSGNTSRFNYSNVSNSSAFKNYVRPDDRRLIADEKRSSSLNYDDIVFNSRGEAEEVLTSMDDLISVYNVASVSDFFDLVGEPSDYTMEKYGWKNLKSAQVERVRGGGYAIRFPRAMPIN